MTYTEATKAWQKTGAAHAQGEGLQAIAADLLAGRLCLRPKPLYEWGRKHGVDLWELVTKKIDIPTEGMSIVGAFLEDIPLRRKDG